MLVVVLVLSQLFGLGTPAGMCACVRALGQTALLVFMSVKKSV